MVSKRWVELKKQSTTYKEQKNEFYCVYQISKKLASSKRLPQKNISQKLLGKTIVIDSRE